MNLFEVLHFLSMLDQVVDKTNEDADKEDKPEVKVMSFSEFLEKELGNGKDETEDVEELDDDDIIEGDDESDEEDEELDVRLHEFFDLLTGIPDHLIIKDVVDHVDYSEENRTTEVYFKNGEHEKVVASPDDLFDPELGVMYCIMQHLTEGKQYLNDIRSLIRKCDQKKRKEELEQIAKEEAERKYKKEKARKAARKARRKREYDASVMKEALLELKKEGLI